MTHAVPDLVQSHTREIHHVIDPFQKIAQEAAAPKIMALHLAEMKV